MQAVMMNDDECGAVVLLFQHQDQNVSLGASSPSLGDVMTSSVVASILQRRRPQVSLTLDTTAPRYSPPAPLALGPATSRRSSASIDSGYGSSLAASPTFPVVDIFTPPPPLPSLGFGPRTGGPLTAPLPLISQSPGWLRQPCPSPTNPGHESGFARPASFKNELYFVFDGLNFRR